MSVLFFCEFFLLFQKIGLMSIPCGLVRRAFPDVVQGIAAGNKNRCIPDFTMLGSLILSNCKQSGELDVSFERYF